MKQTLLALILVLSSTAFAGHEVGNGGGVVYCLSPVAVAPPAPQPGPTVELLDLYEARELRNLTLALGSPNEDYRMKIDRVLTQLARIAPYRAQLYRGIYNRFNDEAVFVANIDLVYIPDAAYKGLPPNCSMKQAVIQQVPEFLGDKRYTISLDLWNMLDSNSKAALVLHEIIYNEAIALGQNTSQAVRYLTSFMTSTSFAQIDQMTFNKMLFSAKIPLVDYLNYFVWVQKPYLPDTEYKFNTLMANRESYYGLSISYDMSERVVEYYTSQLTMPKQFRFNDMTFDAEFFYATGTFEKPTVFRGVTSYDSSKISEFVHRNSDSVRPFMMYFENDQLVGFKSQYYFESQTLTFKVHDFNGQISSFGEGQEKHMASLFFKNSFYLTPSNEFEGLIQTVNAPLNYKSAMLTGAHYSKPGKISDHGVILSGYLQEGATADLPTTQGLRKFTGSLSSQYVSVEKPIVTNESGMVQTGYLMPGQTVSTASGPVTLNQITFTRFLDNGTAEFPDPKTSN